MKIELQEITKRKPKEGDVVVLDGGRVRMIVYDDYKFAFMCLSSGVITSCWYNDVEDLVEKFFIQEVYSSDSLKLTTTD